MNTVLIPEQSRSYRWYYLDVSNGEYTFVAIFMLGGLFSPRYAKASQQGALPSAFSAVNCAVYRHGRRVAWVLSEYGDATVDDSKTQLTVGGSRFTYTDQGCDVVIVDQTTPFMVTSSGSPFVAKVSAQFECPAGDEVQLFRGEPHFWQPRAPYSKASVDIPSLGLTYNGSAYHDLNHGTELLGSRIAGWEWQRTHHSSHTHITYRPHNEATDIQVVARPDAVNVERIPKAVVARRRTSWGLPVPSQFSTGRPPSLLESSPFYARLEANVDGELVLGEVADFAKFHNPVWRWMANFKTRVGSRV